MSKAIFHLAFPVNDLEATKRFYVDGLGCTLGRESSSAVTLELKGHQLVARLAKQGPEPHGVSERGLLEDRLAEFRTMRVHEHGPDGSSAEAVLREQLEQARAGEEAQVGRVEQAYRPVSEFASEESGDDACVADVGDRDQNPSIGSEERRQLIEHAPWIAQVFQDVRADDGRYIQCRRRQPCPGPGLGRRDFQSAAKGQPAQGRRDDSTRADHVYLRL